MAHTADTCLGIVDVAETLKRLDSLVVEDIESGRSTEKSGRNSYVAKEVAAERSVAGLEAPGIAAREMLLVAAAMVLAKEAQKVLVSKAAVAEVQLERLPASEVEFVRTLLDRSLGSRQDQTALREE